MDAVEQETNGIVLLDLKFKVEGEAGLKCASVGCIILM